MKLHRARRIALAAQGFADPVGTQITRRQFRRVLKRMSLLQLDSVQAVCRSHYLPVFSRLGPYCANALDAFTYQSDEVLETWAHEASLIPMDHEPLLRWRKEQSRQGQTWANLYQFAQKDPQYIRAVLAEVSHRGPLRPSELSDPRPRTDRGFWGGSTMGKVAMEWLFRTGQLCARRNQRFQRVYDIAERVIPADVRSIKTPDCQDAQRQLLLLAAQSHGIGTLDCLADYYRIKTSDARHRMAELVEEGQLRKVCIDPIGVTAYVDPVAKAPREISTCTILSPFDPVVWNRKRAKMLFGFEYKIEIYVPAHKRKYGYYVLPFLLNSEIVGRVEVKRSAKTSTLQVLGAWVEEPQNPQICATALSTALQQLREHLQLDAITPPDKGNLATALSTALCATHR